MQTWVIPGDYHAPSYTFTPVNIDELLRDSQNLIGQVTKIRYSGTEEVSPQVSSCDSQTAQGALLQQEQQYDSMETCQQSYLSSAARVVKKISTE